MSQHAKVSASNAQRLVKRLKMNNDKLNMQSVNGTALNIENIAALFPHCVTESAEGKKIDFDLLKQELLFC